MRELSESSFPVFELAGTVTIYTFLLIIVAKLLVSGFSGNRGQCSYAIWQNISFLTLIHWIPLISLNEDSELESFFKQLAVIFRPFELPEFCPDSEVTNKSFKRISINSSGFINNAKGHLIVYIFVLVCCISIFIVGKFSTRPIVGKLKGHIKWNGFIRLHLVFYLDFITFAVIDINFYSEHGSCSAVNLVLSLIFIISGVVWIIFIPVAIKRRVDCSQRDDYLVVFQGINTLVDEFKPIYETTKYQFYTLSLACRFSLAFCLVFLASSPSVQLLMITGFELIMMIYILVSRPFHMQYEAIIVFLSELSCLTIVITVGVRSMKTLSESSKYNASYFCILMIWTAEILIVIRFILRIVYHKKIESRLPARNSGSSIIPVTTGNIDDRFQDSRTIRSSKFSEISIERIHDDTGLHDVNNAFIKIESFHEDHLATVNVPHYVNESEGTERKIMNDERKDEVKTIKDLNENESIEANEAKNSHGNNRVSILDNIQKNEMRTRIATAAKGKRDGNHSSAGNRNKPDSIDENMPKLKLFSERPALAQDSSRIILTADNTAVSPSAREAARHLEEAEENAQIKEFLSKLKEDHIRVGNFRNPNP